MTSMVSISRLHKLIDRLKDRINQVSDEFGDLMENVNVRGKVNDQTFARSREQVALGLKKMDEAAQLSRECARLRAIVAMHNERLGINERLAKQDVLNRLLGKYKALISGSTGDYYLNDLSPDVDLGQFGVTVVTLTKEDVVQIKEKIATLQREVFGLSDEVAELNATRIELTLNDDIAALITG